MPQYSLLKNNLRYYFGILVTISFFMSVVSIQARHIKFEHISVNEGLSQSSGRVLFQDSKGFIWCGTQDGLNKFDGYQFKTYRYNPKDENSISESFILAAFEDTNGIIWIGTSGGGLNKFDPETETFVRYQNDSQDPSSMSNNFVNAVYEDKQGNLWLGTNYGLNLFDRTKSTFRTILLDSLNVLNNTILYIYEDDLNNLWIGSANQGLILFDREDESFSRFTSNSQESESISFNGVVKIFEDSYGKLWIGTFNGLNQMDRTNKIFIRYMNNPRDPNSIANNNIAEIIEDAAGNLWIGTLGGGIHRYDRKNDRFIRYQNDPQNPESLNNNFIFSIIEDNSGAIWVGTGGGGINKFDPQKVKFRHYNIDPTKTNNSLDNFVWSVYQDRSRIIWIGTQGGGLFRFDRRSGKFTNYKNNPDNPHSLSQDVVLSILEDRAGRFWIGTQGGGLNRFDPNTGQFLSYQNNPEDSTTLSSNGVRVLIQDNEGFIWAGTQGGGLNRFDPSTEIFKRFVVDPEDEFSIRGNLVLSILEDRGGYLWIGTVGGGLNRFDKISEKFTHYFHDPSNPNSLSHDRVRVIFEDDKGVLWVGTDYGLNKFDEARKQFKKYTMQNGLPNDVIYGILSDEEGNLWISTNVGISKFNPKNETFKNYDVDDGLQSNEFNTGAYFQNDRGEMLFGGINGFNMFHPDDIQDNPNIPPVVLTEFRLFGKTVKLENSITYTDKIVLSHKEHSISIEFAALDYTNPSKNQFAYMLEGFDENWIYSGTRRTATYTNLEPGEYRFNVNGSNNDLIWNLEGVSVEIIITPPFWQTWWFRFLAVVVIFLIIFFLFRSRMKTVSLKSKLKAAHDAQMSIMPQEDPHAEGFDISGICIPANEVGGDFYDYLWIDEEKNKLMLVVGDVSGKAMKSAMTAVLSSGLIYARAGKLQSVKEIMTDVNSTLYEKIERTMFTALFLGQINLKTKRMSFVNAGLCEPLIKEKEKVSFVEGTGPKYPLGVGKETSYEEKEVTLKSGDVLVLISDGIPEAQNKMKELYGYDTLRKILKETPTDNLSAYEIRELITNDVKNFSKNASQHDDMTVVVVKVL